MKQLKQAIKSRLEGTAALSSLGTLYYGLASDTASFPRWTFQEGATSKLATAFGGQYIEKFAYGVDIWHTDLVTLETYADAVAQALDRATFAVAGARLVSSTRTGSITSETAQANGDGEIVYRHTSIFLFEVDRSR